MQSLYAPPQLTIIHLYHMIVWYTRVLYANSLAHSLFATLFTTVRVCFPKCFAHGENAGTMFTNLTF